MYKDLKETDTTMSIRNLNNIIKELENDIELYLNLKKINFEKTQLKSLQYKDIIIKPSWVSFGKFDYFLIKDEEYDNIIYEKSQKLLIYQQRLVQKLLQLSKLDEKKLNVVLLRDDEEYISKHGKPRTWVDIGGRLGYSERQAQRIYKEYINK